MPKYISKILLVTSLLGIVIFAFGPGQWTPVWIAKHDKFSHMVVFFVLTLLLNNSFPKINIFTQIALLFSFGIFIELMQLMFFNRHFSLLDITYDLFGIGLFYLMNVVLPIALNNFNALFDDYSIPHCPDQIQFIGDL